MPVWKSGPRPGHRFHEPAQIGLYDEFPTHFLEYLQDLPSDEPSSPEAERPAKRAKLDINTTTSQDILIGRGQVTIKKHQPVPTSLNLPFARSNIGTHLQLVPTLATPSECAKLRFLTRDWKQQSKIDEIIDLAPGSYGKDIVAVCAPQSPGRRSEHRHLVTVISLHVSFDADTGHVVVKLSSEVRWKPQFDFSDVVVRDPHGFVQRIVDTFLGPSPLTEASDKPWSSRDFYKAAFVPYKDDPEAHAIQVSGLHVDLFPFQKRTLKWLLAREGVQWQDPEDGGSSTIRNRDVSSSPTLPHSFWKTKDAEGNDIYTSELFNVVTTDLTRFREVEAAMGGILAEEMGLGKTVEILALILLHGRAVDQDSLDYLQNPTADRPAKVGTTLIVTPPQLLQQWLSEIATHAPGLKVTHYKGCRADDRDQELNSIRDLAGQDIVVTTYSVLSSELWFSKKVPDRERRNQRVYYLPTSPLMQLQWWRICLDEAQLVDTGVGKAAQTATILPRINSWAISGTPVRKEIQDLRGLLVFLRCAPYSYSTQLWNAVTARHNKKILRKLFNQMTLRHTKPMVRHEIRLPHQNRHVITVPFTAYEEHEYRDLFKTMAKDCGVTLKGQPLEPDNWHVDEHRPHLAAWLTRLRLFSVSPMGSIMRAAQRRKWNPKTETEAVDMLQEMSVRDVHAKKLIYLNLRLSRGMLLENGPRVQEALELWQDVKRQAADMATAAEEILKKELKAMEESEEYQEGNPPAQDDSGNSLLTRVNEARRRLRLFCELKHKATFCCGNAYFQIRSNVEMTDPNSEDFKRLQALEDQNYEDAKEIRRALLAETQTRATKLMDQIQEKANSQTLVAIPEIDVLKAQGIETGTVIDNLSSICEELDAQAAMIDDWREEMVRLVLVPLLDETGEDKDKTGEEWEQSIAIQGKLEAYVKVLDAAISDREYAINGGVNARVEHELTVARREAEEAVERGEATEEDKMLLALIKEREASKPSPHLDSVRHNMSKLRQIQNSAGSQNTDRARVEAEIAGRQLRYVAMQANKQSQTAKALHAELNLFSSTVKARMDFYNHLQQISDSLNPYEGPKDDGALRRREADEEKAEDELRNAEMKQRYLLRLRESGGKKEEACHICVLPYEKGTLTACGHMFCRSCMLQWWRGHRNCPMCKAKLKSTDLLDIFIRSQEMEIHDDSGGDPHNDRRMHRNKTRPSIYAEFSVDKLEEIKAIKLPGGARRSTKVDMMIRHILWLRQADPGSKSIIFSSFPCILDAAQSALRINGITCVSMREKNGAEKFKGDPDVEVFLLSAQAHASGLNLVESNHIFLCEPLLNTALELQAIARVDRIGQKHETNVWLYLVKGSVEESIYNLSASRRMNHMGAMTEGKGKEPAREEDETLEEANRMELENSRLSKLVGKEGEVIDADDYMQCLFGPSCAIDADSWTVEEEHDLPNRQVIHV